MPPTDDSSSLVPQMRGVARGLEPWEIQAYRRTISPTVDRRLRRLARQEAKTREQRVSEPEWAHGTAVPGLIVAERYVHLDAFGAARQIAALDIALRRGAALIKLYEDGGHAEEWPRPVLPQSGGLTLLDARYSSLDLLWTAYGTVAAVAASTPVCLASFASLAWQAGKYTYAKAHSWSMRRLGAHELTERPSAGDPVPVDAQPVTWQERTSKRLIPVLQEATKNGDGLDFRMTGPDGEVRLIVVPRSQADPLKES